MKAKRRKGAVMKQNKKEQNGCAEYSGEHHYRTTQSFFPEFVLKDAVVVSAYMALFFLVVFFFPDILTEPASKIPADPYTTPAHIKPEWYFLAAYQELKVFPNEFVGLALQVVFMTFLALFPFIDRSKGVGVKARPLFTLLMVLGILSLIGLTIWGKVS